MNDIWSFFLGLSDGFRAALADVNPLPILIVAIVIGLLQKKPEKYAMKAAGALALVLAFNIFLPLVRGGQPAWADISRISSIAQYFLMYVFAYGMIGVLGSVKSLMNVQVKKA
ncbi:MAG: hypothetical protein QM647_04230 [Asticcacaulis sp.]|uniref:hypothetical protein n=1 Tax=Asticcacaulis sp. TaxID=1872648 RepID=UPI0039E722F4